MMNDSGDMFGGDNAPPWQDGPPPADGEARPSADELEAEGQAALFGAPAQPPVATPAPEPAPPPEPAPVKPAELAEPSAAATQPYRVLARKYRPQTFSELIGQDAMVQTLANAIRRDRLAHAFLMTGVRGVGKTSTARLIAKALNCVGPDGQGGPTIDPCGQCEACVAIAEGRHMDVIEMDAASHTGVDDMRAIIEAVRYAAVSARYKIYIIDEVHMLSKNAFNALLKTLEEPPAHVKFLFATTEVDKLPVTVLSRTQRFDLRRITTPLLQSHFATICVAEGVEADAEALLMIAAAAEGSVRDGLSILDQAIAHADMETGGRVTADRVRDMLGLADKGARRALFGALLGGDAMAMLEHIDRQYALGVEPLALVRSLMDLAHQIAIAQVSGGTSVVVSMEERADLEAWTARLTAGQVHRLWQLLLRGYDEIKGAPDPLVTLRMAMLRILHAVDMPDPGKLARQIEDLAAGAALAGAPLPDGAPASPAPAQSVSWAALCEDVDQSGALRVAGLMRDWVRVIDLEPGRLTFALAPGLATDPATEIRDALAKVTGRRWEVVRGEGEGVPSLREAAEALRMAEADRIRSAPLVQAALEAFPGAEFVEADDGPRGERKWNRRA
jgi:DNA polymerase-3 subunit gamma/tau